jgi:glycosyltransferase involved in cell wall biosynthesis
MQQQVFVNARFLTQPITGVQRYASELSIRLKSLIPEIRFISPANIKNREIADLLNPIIVGKNKGHLWEQIDLPLYLNKLRKKPLLVNLANTAPIAYVRKISTIHDLAFLYNKSWYSWKFYYFYKFLIPKVAKSSLQIVTVSDFSRKELISRLKLSSEKITMIYEGVSIGFADSFDKSYAERFGTFVLAVSSFDKKKNFERLIKSFASIDNENIKLVIVGPENRIFGNQNWRSIVEANERIVLTGFISDEQLVSLYRNAVAFVYPSLYEGFGLPPLEAMVCGCPVIASNVASLPEICGDAALYCDPYDTNDIADKIVRLVVDSNLRSALIEKGNKRVQSFSWEKTAEEFKETIEQFV